jgi:hypothetical protein
LEQEQGFSNEGDEEEEGVKSEETAAAVMAEATKDSSARKQGERVG